MQPTLSEQSRALWAKSDRGKESGRWLPVWCHLLDVAACAHEILLLEPPSTLRFFQSDFGCESPERALAWTCALVGLHDLGKASPAFQQKNEECLKRVFEAGLDWGMAKPTRPPGDLPHGVTTFYGLRKLLKEEASWGRESAELLGKAVGMHHGWPIKKSELPTTGSAEIGKTAWENMRRELFFLVLDTLGVEKPWPKVEMTAQAFQRLAGLTSFADWVGSSFDFGDFSLEPKEYWRNARLRASQRLSELGWRKRIPFVADWTSLADRFHYLCGEGQRFQSRPLQVAMESLVRGLSESTLLLVEAPMGEGKTEAGLYAALELQRQLEHRGVYVALPTKATGNAMFARVVDFLRSLKREIPIDLHLLHSGKLLNEEYQELCHHSNTEGDFDDSVTAEYYFTDRKRALLSEAGVGTIDQALIGVLPVKHQFVRLWGLGNRVVLLDEVHAYDTYTGTLLESLLEWLFCLGSSVILMSATLPDERRRAMLGTWRPQEIPPEGPGYPRITRVSGGVLTQVSFQSRPQGLVEIVPQEQDLESVAQALIAETSDGGCVACIVNTVDRAQKLYRILKEQTADVYLFHARFPMIQRQQLEEQALRMFGKEREHRPHRAILVATQVVEQSLDLDFDVMYSDLAPIDLLLQRCGRLHRHSENRGARHGHERARLHILGLPVDDSVPEVKSNYWDRVYNEYVLLRTWLCLREVQEIDLQIDIDGLVQQVYGPCTRMLPLDVQALLDRSRDELAVAKSKHADIAHYSTIGSPTDGSWKDKEHRGSDIEEGISPRTKAVSTRLGDPSQIIVAIYRKGDRYFLDAEMSCEVSLQPGLNSRLAKKIFLQSLSTSRQQLVHCLKDRFPWSRTPLLKGVAPLIVDEQGIARFGQMQVRLDSDLGLVYEKLSDESGENS